MGFLSRRLSCHVCARERCICHDDRAPAGSNKPRNERAAVREQVVVSGPFGTRVYRGRDAANKMKKR